jgi:hypothetical protein
MSFRICTRTSVWLPQHPSVWILSLGFRLKYKTMQIVVSPTAFTLKKSVLDFQSAATTHATHMYRRDWLSNFFLLICAIKTTVVSFVFGSLVEIMPSLDGLLLCS